MNIFVVTDTHIGHEKLIEAGERPRDFEARIKKNWSNMVKDEDLVIHLGDVWLCASGYEEDFFSELPGRKILTLGNHDKKSIDHYMKHGFNFVCDSFSLKRFGLNVQFSHTPMDGSHFDLNIHGHIHTRKHRDYDPMPNRILLSLEEVGYQPRTLKSLVEAWQRTP